MLNHVMDALAPKSEHQCTNEQVEQLQRAGNNFETCVGFSDFDRNKAAELIETLTNGCQLSGGMSSNKCMDVLLANQGLATIMRHMYRNAGKYCQCTKTLQNEIPSCSTTLGDMIDKREQVQFPGNIDTALM
jgi:hypothetical protein